MATLRDLRDLFGFWQQISHSALNWSLPRGHKRVMDLYCFTLHGILVIFIQCSHWSKTQNSNNFSLLIYIMHKCLVEWFPLIIFQFLTDIGTWQKTVVWYFIGRDLLLFFFQYLCTLKTGARASNLGDPLTTAGLRTNTLGQAVLTQALTFRSLSKITVKFHSWLPYLRCPIHFRSNLIQKSRALNYQS